MSGTGKTTWSAYEGEYHPPTDLKTDQPHSARMYDYLLGGKDNFPADRDAAEKAVLAFPTLRTAALENRKFLGRAVRHLVEEAGINQFLDLGSGLPTAENVHQVAQRHDPRSHVVYVDNDPIVLVHGRALLEEDERTTVIQADARNPQAILAHSGTRHLIDFTRPVGVLVVALLHFLTDEEDPAGIVSQLRQSLPPGSHVVLSHGTKDLAPEAATAGEQAYRARGVPLTLRDKATFESFFTDMELLPPGVQVVSDWRSEVPEDKRPAHAEVSWYGGVGRIV